MAGIMLDQNPGEAFERTEHRAMQHYRGDLVRVLINVKRSESAGKSELDLNRPALPIAADRVAQHVFEFRAVEGTFALIERPRPSGSFERGHQRSLGLGPNGILADTLRRPVRELDGHVREAEVLVDREDEIVDLERL